MGQFLPNPLATTVSCSKLSKSVSSPSTPESFSEQLSYSGYASLVSGANRNCSAMSKDIRGCCATWTECPAILDGVELTPPLRGYGPVQPISIDDEVAALRDIGVILSCGRRPGRPGLSA